MRERLPHDYLAALGLSGVIVGLLFGLRRWIGDVPGMTALGIWAVWSAYIMFKYR
jgi:hypothetical protein